MSNLPKLSYVLLTYNRERYIQSALESAFAQEYDGELEYIISDDCSTDNTFKIIRDSVAEYKGNRKVIVIQTPRNMHLAGNINYALKYASGDFVIRADDDDISCRNRCALIGAAVQKYPNCSFVLGSWRAFSDREEMISKYQALNAYTSNKNFRVIDVGITGDMSSEDWNYNHQAWSRKVYVEFGPLSEKLYFLEDYVALLRAVVLGNGVLTNSLFAYIRKGEAQMSTSNGMRDSLKVNDIIAHELAVSRAFIDAYHPLLLEFEALFRWVSTNCTEDRQKALINYLSREREKTHKTYLSANHWKTPFVKRMWRALWQKNNKLFAIVRALPLPLYAIVISLAKRFR